MLDWLLTRLADRLGVQPAEAGEAIVPHIRFEQPWPQVVTLLVILGASALIIWLYRREGDVPIIYKMGLATIRITLLLLTIFMLSEAVLSVERTGLPYFVFMVDDSASGQIVDHFEDPKVKTALGELTKQAEPTRLAVAKSWLSKDNAKVIQEIQKQNKVRFYLVSSSARMLSEIDKPANIKESLDKINGVEASGGQSRLGAGVRQVLTELRGVPPSAIVLLSDGQTTDGESLSKAAEFASRKGVPIYTIGLGSSEAPRDLELTELLVDDVVFVDDLVRFQAKLQSRGFAGQEVVVKLMERDRTSADPKASRELERIKVTVPPDGQPKRIEIGHRPKRIGEVVYTLEVDSLPRESQADNNRIERLVNVRKEKLKVLLVDGEPRYEYRYLKNYLEREETIDLNVVLLSSDPEYNEQDRVALPTIPASKEDLFAYDVILMGDADSSFLSASQMQNIADFVTEKGGGILFVAGENFDPLSYKGTPLEFLLPIELGDARNPSAVGNAIAAFRPELTVEGRSSPIFRFGDDEASSAQIWQGLPELFWHLEAPRKKPAAIVLAEHPTQMGSDGKLPIFLYQFVGSGKSMLNAVDDTWRWRFRVGDRYFGRLWIQTIRFLARSKLTGQKKAEIETDRRRYQRNQPIQVRVRFPNPAIAPTGGEVSVQVERKGQAPKRLTLKPSPGTRNLFEGTLPQASEGEYEVRLMPPPALDPPVPPAQFRVDAPAGEMERVQMNEAELLRAATTSAGKYYTPYATASFLKDLPRPQKVPLDTDPPIPLWNTWPVLTLFLFLIGMEWVLRKRKQMV
ncbi:VWA domain-containing protein [Singulisphaera sp. PoT]|uniref:VWA domain-containing protein n=1 Tax=Singulisphaera sp. PoT TaxID=3411797 RepID=UPI003BF5A95F